MSSEVAHAILNTLFISIPEEFLLITAMLLVSYYLKVIDFNKKNILKALIPTAIIASIANILLLLHFNKNNILFINMFLFFILILLFYKNTFIKQESPLILAFKNKMIDLTFLKIMGKLFLSVLMIIVITIIFELGYATLIVNSTELTTDFINSNLEINILITLPERIVQILIVLLMPKYLKFDIIKSIMSDKKRTMFVSVILLIIIIIIALFGKLFIFDRILLNLNIEMQIVIVLSVILLPILYIIALYYIAKNAYEAAILKMLREKLNDKKELNFMLKNIEDCLNKEHYDKIHLVLKDFQNLYIEEE
jgi:hypothetical protein